MAAKTTPAKTDSEALAPEAAAAAPAPEATTVILPEPSGGSLLEKNARRNRR
jgi:hypothetical protein